MRLLLDEMWPPEIAVQLRQRGHDVIAVAERPDLRGQPDTVVFAAAQAELRPIVTENVIDYRPLAAHELRRGNCHAGLIFTTNRRFPRHDSRTTGRMVAALAVLLSMDLDVGNLEHWLS
ncbi:MAG: hypothetical protein EPO21_12780 [Chloroflexota bacterium]|nr:MAG: hypothetical protein EPO21_12780 [Chloroflexota bacterium]